MIDGNRVFIYGVEGMLHCLDASNGNVVWKKDVNQQFGVIQNFFGIASTPTVFEDLIIVMVGGSPAESQKVAPGKLNKVKPNGSGIVAFDKLTGEVRYQAVNDLASYSSLRVADINGEPTLLAWMRASLYGLEPKTGKEKFSFYWRAKKLESVNAAMPVAINGDKVLLTECYERGSVLLKVDPESREPEVVWSDQNRNVATPPCDLIGTRRLWSVITRMAAAANAPRMRICDASIGKQARSNGSTTSCHERQSPGSMVISW